MSLHILTGTNTAPEISVPIGRSFTLAINGTYIANSTGDEIYIQYFDGINWIVFLTLASVNGYINYQGISSNYGTINSIKINLGDHSSETNIRAILNVVPLERALM